MTRTACGAPDRRRFSCKCSTRAVRAWTCTRTPSWPACDASRRPLHQEVRSFGTTTAELLDLADWLAEHDCTHVAMEATGVYWKPVWHVLEAEFELVLANAAHIRNVPGRKTDVNDAMWIADLLAHGLIRSSFVPPQAIQELRDLTRTRKQLVREVSQHSLRIQKVLEDANLKLGSVLSDVLGKSGRAMLEAIVAGETDPARLAALAQGTARNKSAELREALRGRITEHHRTLLKLHLQVIDALAAHAGRTGCGRGKSAGADPAARPPADDDAGGQ